MRKKLFLAALMALALPVFAGTDQYDEHGKLIFKSVSVPLRGTDIPHSGTITLGGAAQQVMAQNLNRTHFFFQNVSDTDMWIRWTTGNASAGAGSVLIRAGGGAYENSETFCPTGAISVFCATTGKEFTATEN